MAFEYDYIEAYFTQTLGEEERKNFEARCVDDKDFANEVAFYIASRQVIRQELLEQKQKLWATGNEEDKKIVPIKPRNKTLIQRLLPYAAAACVILIAGLFFLFKPPSPQQLADDYINKNYSQLHNTLGLTDSLQTAIIAYNNKDYTKALVLFEALEISHPDHSDEKKYAGLVSLATKNYDKALQQFDELAKMKNVFGNEGNFLKAITLLQRNATGDKEQAKQLLQQIVNNNEEGSEQAKDWLSKF